MTEPQDIHTLVVTDLDNSFWGNDVVCHPDTLAAQASLAERGVGFLVATGRRASSAAEGLRANGLDVPCVLLNGALGVDFTKPDDSALKAHRFHMTGFPDGHADEVVDVFLEHGLQPCVYVADGRVVISDNPSTSDVHLASLRSFDGELIEEELRGVGARREILYAAILGADPEVLGPCVEQLASVPCETAAYSDHMYGGLSVMAQPSGVSKWVGIQAYIEYAGINPERVIAVGDGGNDLEMLEHATIGLAVEGGDERALAIGDHVIAPPDNGGWAEVLNYL